jgi:hypothetical protein
VSLRIKKDGQYITAVDEWFRLAPPKKGIRQWVDGRSAKELAKAFLEGGVPAVPTEVRSLLSSSRDLGAVDLELALPEHKIALDQFPGETRNADLAAVGECSVGKVAVTIEAKADESFGGTIAETLKAASPRSNVPRRINALATALLGHAGPEINNLRYQLLHGIAASLIFARDQAAAAAVFIVFELRGSSCTKENLERNARDFDLFVKTLSPSAAMPQSGNLIGPLFAQGGGLVPARLPLFVGKAIRNIFQGSVAGLPGNF